MSQKLTPYIDDKGVNHKPIHIDLKTEMLYYLKKHQGRLIKFSLRKKKDQLNAAKRVANEELVSRLGKKKIRRGVSFCRDEFPLFIAKKESEGLDPSTLVRIKSTIKLKLEPFWSDKLVSEINEQSVDEWIHWYKTEFKGETMDNAIKYLKTFCSYLQRKIVHGVPLLMIVPIVRDPDLKRVKANRAKKTKRTFSKQEFFDHVYPTGCETGALALLIMYTMGTRIEETLTMRFDEEILINQPRAVYRWSIGQNKADHEGEHKLHSKLVPILHDLYLRRKAEGTKLLFPQVHDKQKPISARYIDFNEWRQRANLGWHWTSKTCRHTCLTNLFNDSSVPQVSILKLYRVSLRVAMGTYAKVTEANMDKLQDFVEVPL